MITKEDIRQLIEEVGNVAHAKARCPTHRYEGKLTIKGGNLAFDSYDVKGGREFELEIPFENITDVNFEFNREIQEDFDLVFGEKGAVPFIICYHEGNGERVAYFNANVDNYTPHTNVNNLRWYETLDEILAEQRYQELKRN